MNTIESLLRAARDEGLVPTDATLSAMTSASRPWPVVLLTALGAWLAAIPMLVVIGLLFGNFVTRDVGAYIVGAMLLAGAVVVLHSRGVPLFVEQLVVPALVAGLGTLGLGLFRDLGGQGGALVLGIVTLAVGLALRAPWLRVLLGAGALVLFVMALGSLDGRFFAATRSAGSWWLAMHLLLVPWLVVHVAQQRHAVRGRAAGMLESMATGWGLALLTMLAWWSGMTFLVGGAVGGLGGEIVREMGSRGHGVAAMGGDMLVSAALALAGAGVAARRWPALRHPALIGAGLVVVALAALMPTLGATVLLLALLATSGRWRMAAAAAVAAAWIVGAFYYQLAWPLSTKAAVLAVAGAVLLGLARWAGAALSSAPAGASATAAPAVASAGRTRLGIALTVLAVVVVANVGIVQKERLIRDGKPVFVALAPADPRSLMQGDFMRLNFSVPDAASERRAGLLRLERPRAVARVDARGVAQLMRIQRGEPLAPGELAIELTPKEGRWTLVTDAWFFAEGEAQRWQRARFGEFRVDDSGRALLVGLRGENLEPL